MKNVDLLYKAINLLPEEMIGVSELIQSFIRSNTDVSNEKFNLYDYTEKKSLRSFELGVYHEKGFKVATDSYLLIRIKSPYDVDLEGKIIDIKGMVVDAKYPNYMSVKPQTNKDDLVKVDLDKAKLIAKDAKLHTKATGNNCYVKVKDVYFPAESFRKLCVAADYMGVKHIQLNGDKCSCLCENSKGEFVLLFPANSDYVSDCKVFDY